jgi:sulfotransferase
MSRKRFVFNSSLSRSGSTLLQNILAQNPRFHCSATSGVFELLYQARKAVTETPQIKAQEPELMRRAFLGACGGFIEGFYQALTDRPVVIDKSKGWLNHFHWLEGFCPEPKVIVCVRDLRAVISSMEKLFLKKRHLLDPADVQIDMKMITTEQRVIHWLNSIPIGMGVLRLLDAIHTGVIGRCHVVRFEDLTSAPDKTVAGIYKYLGEEPYRHDFDNVDQVTHENDAYYPIYGDHQIRRKVEPVPLDFNDVLGRSLSEQIREQNAVFYQTFYPHKI